MQAVSPAATVKVHSPGLADSRAVGQRILPVHSPNSQLILFAELGGLNEGVVAVGGEGEEGRRERRRRRGEVRPKVDGRRTVGFGLRPGWYGLLLINSLMWADRTCAAIK